MLIIHLPYLYHVLLGQYIHLEKRHHHHALLSLLLNAKNINFKLMLKLEYCAGKRRLSEWPSRIVGGQHFARHCIEQALRGRPEWLFVYFERDHFIDETLRLFEIVFPPSLLLQFAFLHQSLHLMSRIGMSTVAKLGCNLPVLLLSIYE